MRTRRIIVAAAALAWSLLAAHPAHAALVWDGDPAQGTSVLGNVECADGSALVTAADPDGHGTIFRYTKAATSERCESRGIKVGGTRYTFGNGGTYWFGWENKVSTVTNGGGDFVVWQWKSYPAASQNYPLLMTVQNGTVQLKYVAPGEVWNTIWTMPVAAMEWHRFAVGIHASDSASAGWVELYADGVRQTFTNGTTRYYGRTWDSANEPKWGAYDHGNLSTEIVNRVDGLRMGTSYGDVD